MFIHQNANLERLLIMSNLTTKTEKPFSKEMIEDYNRFSQYQVTLAQVTDNFNQQVAKDRELAVDTLTEYGIYQIPDDVQHRLDRLKQARRYIFIADVRSRNLAPPPTGVGWTNYHKYARVDKANRVLEKAFNMLKKANYNLSTSLQKYSPNKPISSDDVNAIDKLKEKISKAEQLQEQMKTANKLINNKKLSDEEKIVLFKKMALPGKSLLQAALSGRKAFADYELTNNNGNIRRMKERVAELEQKRTDVERSWTDGSITIVDSPTEMHWVGGVFRYINNFV